MKTVFEFHQKVRESRERVALHYGALKEEINIPKRLSHSIKQKPWGWLGGAALIGLTLTFVKLPQRRKKRVLKTSSSDSLSSINSKEQNSPRINDLAVTMLTLLNNNAVRTGLFSTARYLFPLIQEALNNYRERKKEKQTAALQHLSSE